MDINYVEIIKWIVIILLGAISYYLKEYTNVYSQVASLIAQAEEIYKAVSKSGSLKKVWCIQELNKVIPKALKVVLTDEVLDVLIQNVFDSITEYVKATAEKAAPVIDETVKDTIDELKK